MSIKDKNQTKGAAHQELPPVRQNVLDSNLCSILLKIGHIIQLNMRNSKMEFANHFVKNHLMVLEHTTIFGCQVQIIVGVSNL